MIKYPNIARDEDGIIKYGSGGPPISPPIMGLDAMAGKRGPDTSTPAEQGAALKRVLKLLEDSGE